MATACPLSAATNTGTTDVLSHPLGMLEQEGGKQDLTFTVKDF